MEMITSGAAFHEEDKMTIAFLEPLSRAWNRMKLALFSPFDLNKWFVVGFNAFLAGLTEGQHGSGGSRAGGDMSFREFLGLPHRGWEWLMNHPGWLLFGIFVCLFLVIIGIVLLWLSSRGVFMFLDNVVQNRAEIAKPWKQFRKEGNSLFVWRLVFSLISVAFFIALIVFFFVAASSLYEASYERHVPIALIVGLAFLALVVILVIGYISLFLKDFVAAIMYKNSMTATQAWRRFLPLFDKFPLHFILYGILVFFIMIVFVMSVIFAGLVTCCIGWLVLIIPYLGTVVTLPVWYTLRAFSLEFLAQFGPDYSLFPPKTTETHAAVAQSRSNK